MLGCAAVVWDVDGMILIHRRGVGRNNAFRVRCYRDGRCSVDIAGIAYPVPRTMTAFQYFDMVFCNAFGPPERRRSSGD